MDTIDRNDAYTVTSLDDLAKIYANPLPHIATKEADHITEVGRAFIAASPFLVLATSDGTSIDCSPKGDAPGFVQLLDDRTLLIPDRPGNNRIDGMKNLLVNPKVGIIFMIPGSNETYRVTGRATLSTDPELLKRFEVGGKPPRVIMVVAVEEAFITAPKPSCGRSCGKRRSGRAAPRPTATSPPRATARMLSTPGIITRNMA